MIFSKYKLKAREFVAITIFSPTALHSVIHPKRPHATPSGT